MLHLIYIVCPCDIWEYKPSIRIYAYINIFSTLYDCENTHSYIDKYIKKYTNIQLNCSSSRASSLPSSSSSARRKNPPSRGAECALQQECQRGSKPRQLPTTKHFENSSIIIVTAHQKSQTTRSYKFLSVLVPRSAKRNFGSWRSTTTTIIIIIIACRFFIPFIYG